MATTQQARWQQKIEHGGNWNEDDAVEALCAWRASGMSLTAFSQEVGTSVQRFSTWKVRLEKEGRWPTQPREPDFVPVMVREALASQQNQVHIGLQVGSVSVQIGGEASALSATWLASLVHTLGSKVQS